MDAIVIYHNGAKYEVTVDNPSGAPLPADARARVHALALQQLTSQPHLPPSMEIRPDRADYARSRLSVGHPEEEFDRAARRVEETFPEHGRLFDELHTQGYRTTADLWEGLRGPDEEAPDSPLLGRAAPHSPRPTHRRSSSGPHRFKVPVEAPHEPAAAEPAEPSRFSRMVQSVRAGWDSFTSHFHRAEPPPAPVAEPGAPLAVPAALPAPDEPREEQILDAEPAALPAVAPADVPLPPSGPSTPRGVSPAEHLVVAEPAALVVDAPAPDAVSVVSEEAPVVPQVPTHIRLAGLLDEFKRRAY